MRRLKEALVSELPFMCSVPALIWQVLFIGVPLIIIIYLSFHTGITTWSFSLQAYRTIFQLTYIHIIMRSLLLALGTAAICLLCAYPVAYIIALRIRRWKNAFLFLLMLPFWINLLIQIYAWYFVLERQGLLNTLLLKLGLIHQPLEIAHSITAVFIVMVYCYLPFMIMPLYSILEKLDVRLLEASFDLGATHWQTFVRVTLPLSLSGIKTGVLLVLVPAFGEFAIPALVGGSKYMMVGSLISYNYLVARDTALGSAFTCLSGIVLLIVAFLFHKALENTYMNRE
jgi:spermidine/putrescine transport system permease protein